MNMGLDTKDVLVIKMDHPQIKKDYNILKAELQKNPDIISVSASSNIPAVTGAHSLNIKIDNEDQIAYRYISIDAGFTENLGVKVTKGRSFKPGLQADIESSFLLNESAVKDLNIENPIGRSILLSVDQNGKSVTIASGEIVGVIEDYSYRGNYERTLGVIYNNCPNRYNNLFVRLNPEKKEETLKMIDKTWNNLFKELPMSVSFLDDEIKNEIVIQKLSGLQRFISAVSIFSFILALLGLFGLSIFATKQRIKEIGIRRVNGASIAQLLLIINKKFILLILIAISISYPIIIFLVETIMSTNANSAHLSLINYSLSFFIISGCTVLTVSWQSWQAATGNPVKALRYE